MNSRRYRAGLLIAGAVLASSANAPAQSVLFDLGNAQSFRGADTPSPDVNGNHWNSVWSGAFYPDVLDTSGNATSIDFGFTNVTGTDSFNGSAGFVPDLAS